MNLGKKAIKPIKEEGGNISKMVRWLRQMTDRQLVAAAHKWQLLAIKSNHRFPANCNAADTFMQHKNCS
jgi:hypothetical protein